MLIDLQHTICRPTACAMSSHEEELGRKGHWLYFSIVFNFIELVDQDDEHHLNSINFGLLMTNSALSLMIAAD